MDMAKTKMSGLSLAVALAAFLFLSKTTLAIITI